MKCLIVGVLISAISVASVSAERTIRPADCLRNLLYNRNDPEIFSLFRELLRSDNGNLANVEINGKLYAISPGKANFLIRVGHHGLGHQALEQLLKESGIFPVSATDKKSVAPLASQAFAGLMETGHDESDESDESGEPGEPTEPTEPGVTTERPVTKPYKFTRALSGQLTVEIYGSSVRLPQDINGLLNIGLRPNLLNRIIKDMREYGVSYLYDSQRRIFRPWRAHLRRSGQSCCLCRDAPKKIHVQGYTYTLPQHWGKLKADILKVRVYRSLVYLELRAANITMPRDIAELKESGPGIFVSKNFSEGHESQITIGLGPELYQLPRDKESFENTLRKTRSSVKRLRSALARVGVISRRVPNKLFIQLPDREIELTGLPIYPLEKANTFIQSNFVHVRAGNKEYILPKEHRTLGQDLATGKVLHNEVIHGFAENGIKTKFDAAHRELTAYLPAGTLIIKVEVEAPGTPRSAEKEYLKDGYDYTLFLHLDNGIQTIKLPSQLETLADYIRADKIHISSLKRHFDRLGIPDNYDFRTRFYFIKIGGKRYDLVKPTLENNQ